MLVPGKQLNPGVLLLPVQLLTPCLPNAPALGKGVLSVIKLPSGAPAEFRGRIEFAFAYWNDFLSRVARAPAVKLILSVALKFN